MVWLIRFLVGWIACLIVIAILFFSRIITWSWDGDMNFVDYVGTNTVNAMYFKKD